MTSLLLHLLATYGLWFALVHSSLPVWWKLRLTLAERVDWFARLIVCPLCSGFWVSLALACAKWPWAPPTSSAEVIDAVMKALAGAATCYLIDTHVSRLEAR